MTDRINRRYFIGSTLLGAGALAIENAVIARTLSPRPDPVAPYRTPYKYDRLVLAGSGVKGTFDEKLVDCPFVFNHEGKFHMTYVGWDGGGYQTGLAVSDDLIQWTRKGIILGRDPNDAYTRYNIASASILRENDMHSPGRLLKVDGRYVCAWHAYPSAGYEEGPAVIGLAFSKDLMHWERMPPILFPQDGAPWEEGGLYKPYLIKEGGTYYLFYNAKTKGKPWVEQTGLATSTDLRNWKRHPGSPLITNGEPGKSWDSRFASDPVVMRHGKQWALFYFGLASDGKARDLLALGDSLTSFKKVDEILVDVGPRGSIDDKFAHKPSIIHHDDALYHFYCATGGDWPNDVRGIAVARSKPW